MTTTTQEYKIAFMVECSGAFEIVETFEAAGNEEANSYAETNYAGKDWYVLDAAGENINAW